MADMFSEFLVNLEKAMKYPLFSLGKTEFTASSILALIVMFIAVVVAEHFLRRVLLARLLKRTHFDASLQYAISRIAGYAFMILGFYIALQFVGIDLTSLAVLAGAVGVGLGFGLQNIVNNFVSGLIILAERPIALGDRVEVGGVAGRVSQINLRSTTIITNDNISMIVPNADFISHTVTNWSHGDPRVRLRLPVGVAYGSDVEKVKNILLSVGNEHSKVLRDPAPTVFFSGFGDSSLDFELAVWTSEMTFSPRRFKSDLYFAIERKFRENKIEIPFPQRDLHLRSGEFVMKMPERNGDRTERS